MNVNINMHNIELYKIKYYIFPIKCHGWNCEFDKTFIVKMEQ